MISTITENREMQKLPKYREIQKNDKCSDAEYQTTSCKRTGSSQKV